jgi:hypothetical protein
VHSAVNWADKSSIPRLMEALPLDDRYMQYACLRALGKLTGRPIPRESAFNQDRQAVIKAWQAWWEGQERQHARQKDNAFQHIAVLPRIGFIPYTMEDRNMLQPTFCLVRVAG